MLKRKIYSELLDWKNRRKNEGLKKCLLIKGARQVGKSYIVNEFGKNEYESFISINFFKNPELKEIFNEKSVDIRKYDKKSDYVLEIFNNQGNITVNKTIGKVELVKSGAKSTMLHGYGKS